jgi:hypothetical protein
LINLLKLNLRIAASLLGASSLVGSVLAQNEANDWWSVQAIRSSPVPDSPALDQDWVRNEIDVFIAAKLRAQGLAPSPPAHPRVLCRRLYFDLTGLPPTPQQMAGYLKESAKDADKAFADLVERLLASEAYGEKWARHWLDIAHYADTHGFERDKLRENAWRYRDYVIRSLNADKPYDQFLREQIAGDAIAPDDAESVIATGFLSAGPWDYVGQVETKSDVLRRSARALDLDDMVTQVMTATTAMTVNCARCHDHKLDPISQKEYYQLVSIFAGLKRADRVISEEALKRYEDEKLRVDAELQRVSFAINEIRGDALDLADIVGGGNGLGTGKARQGLDPRSAAIREREFGRLGNIKVNTFKVCKDNAFIDGVVIPDGGEKADVKVPISSSGLSVVGVPDTSGEAWDTIRNGPVASQYSKELDGVDYFSKGHSMLGLHANAGITFDLEVIREAAKFSAMKFSAVVGYGGKEGEMRAEYRVYLDGEMQVQGVIGRKEGATDIGFEIPETARFMTLFSTDGGNGIGHDQIFFGDAKLQSATPKNTDQDEGARLTKLEAEQESLKAQRKQLGPPPNVYAVVADEKLPMVHVLDRGDPESPGEAVAPAALSWVDEHLAAAIGDAEMPESERRLALANWITDPRNPLTRRVIVNRLWHWHFGQGLVTTPSDFGLGGDTPSHPELLDFLADKLLSEDWSLKAIHRLMVSSASWRQQSKWRQKPAAVDAQNRWLWRMNPRRLTAEEIRDAVLSVSGKLNRERFGPGYKDFDYKEAYAPIYTYQTADRPEVWRRSVYRFVVRTTPQQFMTALDCADPANLTPKRLTTTTALQSLALYNNDFMLRQSRYLAERLQLESKGEVADQIALAFRLALGRPPGDEEKNAAARLLAETDLFTFCRSLLNSSEFVYLD